MSLQNDSCVESAWAERSFLSLVCAKAREISPNSQHEAHGVGLVLCRGFLSYLSWIILFRGALVRFPGSEARIWVVY